MAFDLVKFAKLMQLSQSSFDGEALTSLRKANAMLLEANLNWDQFISQKTIVINEITYKNIVQNDTHPQQKQNVYTKRFTDGFNPQDITKMLHTCIHNTTSSSGLTFLNSLNDFWVGRGYLSERQYDALLKWYKPFE